MNTKRTTTLAAHRSQRPARRHIAPMRIAICLLIAALATACLIGGTLARYTQSAASADSARVAVFGHSESIAIPRDWTASLKPGDTKTYTITVTNSSDGKVSEVAQRYNIALATSGNLPLHFKLASAGNSALIGTHDESASAATCTFASDSMRFDASVADSHTYELAVTWPAIQNSASLAGVPDFIQINVNVEQID